MKRGFALLCALALLLTGCAASPAAENAAALPAGPWTARARYSLQGLEGELMLRWYGPESLSLEFLSPASVAGLREDCTGGAVTRSFGGIETHAALADLPARHPLRALLSCFQSFAVSAPAAHVQPDGRTACRLGGGAVLYFSRGAFTGAALPADDFTLTVTELED